MSKEKDSVKKERLSMFYKVAPVVGALVLAMLSAVFIVCRTSGRITTNAAFELHKNPTRKQGCFRIEVPFF